MPTQFNNTSEFIEWNEEMTRKYDSEDYHLRSNFIIRWIEKKRVKAILKLLKSTSQDTVVEIGCGAGMVLEQIPAGTVIGMDLSGFILHKTQRRLAKRNALILQGNGENLPFSNNQFDKIVCTEVIEHVMEPRNIASEMARVGTSQSTLVITIPNESLIDNAKKFVGKLGLGRMFLAGTSENDAYHSPEDANEWHLHQFDLPMLREVTADFLIIQKVIPIPFSFLPLRYVVSCRVK